MIAGNMKQLRSAAGISRTTIAKQLGITHQQVRKYENCENSISSEKLAIIAAMLNQPVSALFSLEPGTLPQAHSFSDLKRMHLFASMLEDVVSPLLQDKICALIKSLIEGTPAWRMRRESRS